MKKTILLSLIFLLTASAQSAASLPGNMPAAMLLPDNEPTSTAYDTDDDAHYIERLARLPYLVEMPYNALVRKQIDRYAGQPTLVARMLAAANLYVPIFEQALESVGVPLELKYLPVVESSLDPSATSRAGAAGLWQFMTATAKQYGLDVNTLVDERRDPIKSSYAAATYLRDLYATFGDWHLALAAYNCGPENVNKAIRRYEAAHKGNTTEATPDYWALHPYLPTETQGYVPAFIAANYIMNYYCLHSISVPAEHTNIYANTDTVVVSHDLHLRQVAELCATDIDRLRQLNPQYRQDIVCGSSAPCALRLPAEAIDSYIALEDSLPLHRQAELLPRRATAEPATTATGKSRNSSAKTVTVRNGDTLSTIARRNHTTVARLRQLNGLRGDNIRVGKKLRVR